MTWWPFPWPFRRRTDPPPDMLRKLAESRAAVRRISQTKRAADLTEEQLRGLSISADFNELLLEIYGGHA